MCPAHLQDRHFCSPIIDKEAETARQKEESMAQEIELVKKEYEEKQRRKKEREKQPGKGDKDKDEKAKEKDASDSKTSDEKERDAKVCTEHTQLDSSCMFIDQLPLDRLNSNIRHGVEARYLLSGLCFA